MLLFSVLSGFDASFGVILTYGGFNPIKLGKGSWLTIVLDLDLLKSFPILVSRVDFCPDCTDSC